jgi:hypothetical protein
MKNWETVYTTNQMYLAEMAKLMLADNGIEAVVISKKDSAYNFGDIEVCVNRDHVIKALLLIKEFDS